MATQKDKALKLIAGYCRKESGNMNIVDGIISIIFEYQQRAQWSKQYKGKIIELSEDESKASCVGVRKAGMNNECEYEGNSVRCDFGIRKGDIVSWELECIFKECYCNFMGVVTSEIKDFNNNPSKGMKNAYGLDDREYLYNGSGKGRSLKWIKPRFPLNRPFKIRITANWTDKQCKLIYVYEGKKLNKNNDDYTLLLPEINKDTVLYPCVTPYNSGAYCIIRWVPN